MKSMVNNEKSMYARLAKKFLAGKERRNYYEILALDESNLEEVRFLQEFSNDELVNLCSLREKYGKNDFIKHLDEVYADPDEIRDLACGGDILELNLDKPYHQYRFAQHELRGDTILRTEVLVELTDEEYIRLLSYSIEDKYMNANKLRYADRALHRKVTREVDHCLCDDGFFMGCNPYLITMDEAREDADKVLAENPELCKTSITGYLFI